MKIKLSDEEYVRIDKYTKQLGRIRQQVQNLHSQGDEVVDVAETSWLVAHQRVRLEDPEMRDADIPKLIDEQGRQVVKLNPKDKTAEWQSAHDVKRIGNTEEEPETVEEKSDVE